MEQTEEMRCPFVYATGERCEGKVIDARSYGPRNGEIRKIRLWCSCKYDHQGGTSSWAGKERMEFYPDHLPDDIRDRVLALFDDRKEAITA